MRYVKAAAFCFGAFLLFWIIRKIGWHQLEEGFLALGWRILVPIAILFPCYLLMTLAWLLFLRQYEHHSIPFWTLFRIKVAGEASSALTPINFLGGDPMRIWLLSRNFPVTIGGASVVVDRTLQSLAIVALIFLGNLVAVFKLSMPFTIRALLGGTAGVLFLLIFVLIFGQKRGLFQKLLKLATRLRIRTFSEKTVKRIEELDHHVREFYHESQTLFFMGFFILFFARLLGTLEIFYIGRALGVPMTYWEAIFFAAVIPMTNLVSIVVPGTFGVLEGVVSSLFMALHWDPAHGIILQIARRVRAMFWYTLGFAFLLFFKSKKPSTTPVKVPPADLSR